MKKNTKKTAVAPRNDRAIETLGLIAMIAGHVAAAALAMQELLKKGGK